jgi:hypothetical protein
MPWSGAGGASLEGVVVDRPVRLPESPQRMFLAVGPGWPDQDPDYQLAGLHVPSVTVLE